MDAAQEGPRSNGGALRSRRGDAGAEKDKRSSLVVRSRGVAGQTRRLIKDAQGWYQGQDHGRDQDMADASHPEEETQKSKASFPTRKFADEKLETGSYTPPSLVLQTRKGSGHSQRCGWPVLLWVLGAIGSWSGVGYGLWLSWKESSQAHVHLQHAMWLSQIGLLCLSLAFDCCRKIFVMGTMFVLLPAAFLHFRGLDFEPTVSLMHIISSIHYHYVQDMDNPRAVTRRHETLMVLDYFWAHLDVCSCFVYLSGIQSRYLRAMAYMSFVYGLIALLTSKDRKRRQQHLAALVLGGGCSLLVGRYLLTGEAPRIKWSGLPIPFLLFGYAAYNFFILQEKHPNMYWLHHGLWHITGNATLLALIHLKYVNE